MGIKVLMGRDFSEDFKSDSNAIIINKAGLDLMNLENPIGTKLDLWGSERELIGVVDNTLMGSPFRAISPLFMIKDPDWISAVTIRLSANAKARSGVWVCGFIACSPRRGAWGPAGPASGSGA